ncbi:MAG: D-alanine--D-alanine ligase [Candidatus Ancillula sp.]|jgi:D-alanine-D-alanine ligase|nr:D-alanine--D-alanine ligase [Candidatus Ancillula sp.]
MKTKKIRVGVVFGGKSSEHSISCISASGVLANIDREKYEVIAIGITKSGVWRKVSDNPDHWRKRENSMPEVKEPVVKRFWNTQLSAKLEPGGLDVDVVFPVLHGLNGEDGTIQGMLEMLGTPYVGCKVMSSAMCQDKHFAKAVLRDAGVNVVDSVTIKMGVRNGKLPKDFKVPEPVQKRIIELSDNWKHPIFVKPCRAGSSVGVSKVLKERDLRRALEKAAIVDEKVLVERGVDAREIECAMFKGKPSTLGEIIAQGFYDYNSKYINNKTKLVVDPVMDPESKRKLQETAKTVYDALDLQTISRVDMFLTSSGQIFVNEVNTMPGFTPISMYPTLLEHDGVPYSALIDELIQSAL